MATARTSRRTSKRPTKRGAHAHHRPKQPRISRSRLQTLCDNLNDTQIALDESLDRFWIVPESDVRGTLAYTKNQIHKALALLRKAA